MPHTRRARAGTLPSRLPPAGPPPGLTGLTGLPPKSARHTPSQSPFGAAPSPGLEPVDQPGGSTLLSRLRAGSLPQRSQYTPLPGTSSPFGPSIFSSWNPAGMNRERGSTLASIASVGSNGPSSPSQSQFSNQGTGESDVHMRTLDYLGLAETPQPPQAQLATPYIPNIDSMRQSSRFRSFSVNNKDKYDSDLDQDENGYGDDDLPIDSRYAAAALQNQIAATNAAIQQHNLAVQAFVNHAATTRPRARTAGVLDLPGNRNMRSFMGGNGPVSSPLAMNDGRAQNDLDTEDLTQSVAGISLGRSNSRNNGLLSADEQGLDGPTSALWLGSIPTSTTTSTLTEMFKQHGTILSARVLTHKNCGFVNFERVESAISAKAGMNGKEIFPGAGPIRINFAKPPSASNTPGHDGMFPSPSPDPFSIKSQDGSQNAAAHTSGDALGTAAAEARTPTVRPLPEMVSDILKIVRDFEASEDEQQNIARSLQSATKFDEYVEEIPPIREPTHTRIHDAPKLRDIRKRIDNHSLDVDEIENIAVDMLPEIAELSSDYLGNTVVQKLFEHSRDPIRDAMLSEIAPHLAEIGVHKNGTWAAQKIIEVCVTDDQKRLIVKHLRPYTVPLFLDQYGNYVLQGCLKFKAPFNDFIFEAMLSRMWEIAQGRYGARAMRACLESHFATKDQQRMLAAAVALHSVQLATNANGALLLTWFLDTCNLPQRRTVLSPHLVPYLVHLCTHKVAYLTVLKLINQKFEPEARDIIINALFSTPNDQILEAILSDQSCGATLIFKVLTTPFFDENIRGQVVETVKNVLIRIKAQPNQGYKRLMDEVGLATRSSGSNSRDPSAPPESRQRPSSRSANVNGQHAQGKQPQQQQQPQQQFYNPLNPVVSAQSFDPAYASQQGGAPDSGMSSFPVYNQGMAFNPNSSMPPGMNMQQLQYQQGMMGRGGPQMGYNYPPMAPTGYAGYSNGSPQADQYRQQPMANGNSMQGQAHHMQPPYGPPGFNMAMGGYGGYPNMGGMQGMGYPQQEQGNNRRGRVSGQ